MFDQDCHVLEEANFLHAEVAGPNIQHAQGAHAAFIHEQRAACVKANPRSSGNLRIVGETMVSKSVRDHEQLTSRDGVCTERCFPRRLANLNAMCGLEPLAVPVDQTHKGDRYPEDARSKAGKAVKPLLFRRIKDPETVKSGEALFFVRR